MYPATIVSQPRQAVQESCALAARPTGVFTAVGGNRQNCASNYRWQSTAVGVGPKSGGFQKARPHNID